MNLKLTAALCLCICIFNAKAITYNELMKNLINAETSDVAKIILKNYDRDAWNAIHEMLKEQQEAWYAEHGEFDTQFTLYKTMPFLSRSSSIFSAACLGFSAFLLYATQRNNLDYIDAAQLGLPIATLGIFSGLFVLISAYDIQPLLKQQTSKFKRIKELLLHTINRSKEQQ